MAYAIQFDEWNSCKDDGEILEIKKNVVNLACVTNEIVFDISKHSTVL